MNVVYIYIYIYIYIYTSRVVPMIYATANDKTKKKSF